MGLGMVTRMEEFFVGRAWIDEELGIMRIAYHPLAEIDVARAKEQIEAMGRLLGGGKPLPTLVDLREVRSAERAARDYFAGPETAQVCSACAMVTGSSGVGAALGNFMIARYGDSSLVPLRLFAQEKPAIAWLHTFLKLC